MREFVDVSRSSPKSNNRACYCKDTNTYSKKCCDGTLFAQGIGSITLAAPLVDELLLENSSFILQQDGFKIQL